MVERLRTRWAVGWKGESRDAVPRYRRVHRSWPATSPRSVSWDAPTSVLPSHDVLTNLKAEGKLLAGGYAVGERAATFIFEVDSNEELDSLLQGLPYWGLVKMKTTPLQDIEGRREGDRQLAEQLEQSLQR